VHVVCIGGRARHGKDTLANFLKTHLESEGKRVVILHYADQLKFFCAQYFGWNGEKDSAGRSILQYVGTDYARQRDPDIWVRYVAMFLRMFGDMFDCAIIADCRFPNEIEWVYGEHDCTSIYIYRENFDNGLSEEQKSHPSETSLDDYYFDVTVLNDRGLDELEVIAQGIAIYILSKFDTELKEVIE